MVDTILNGANICFALAFAIIGVIFNLYTKGVEKEFTNLKEYFNEKISALELRHNEFKLESKEGDVEGREEIRRVDGVRVEQISTLHIRVDKSKDDVCAIAQRVARLEK